MKKNKIQIFYIIFFFFITLFSTNSAFAAISFVVDGSNSANSTGPCVGKTICHISGDLTYSNITLQNGGKLSHRQGTLTVVNDFVIGSGSSSYFVGQNLNVGHLLKITNASKLALDSNLTSDPVSTDEEAWQGSTYYDLSVTNTDTTFNGLDINLTSGGYIKTRNAVINSDFTLQSNSTNCYWNTYAGGYISIDGDAVVKNIKMDVDGYVYVGENLSSDFSGAAGYYFYARGGSQVDTPLSTQFLKAGLSVIGNLSFTGNTTTPTPMFFYSSGGTLGDNVYSSGNINMYKMQIGTGTTTTTESLGYLESKNGYININNTNDLYVSANLKAPGNITISTITNVGLQDIISTTGNILQNDITTFSARDIITYIGNIVTQGTWTTHTYRNIDSKQNISITRSTLGGTLNATNLTNSGTTILQNITTYNRVGNILSTGDITLNNITTSSGSSTNITSILGNITISTGTTNTYNDLQAKLNIGLTNISSLTANDVTSTAGTITTQSGTTHIYRDITANQNINVSNISTSLVARNLSNSGTTTLQTITLYNRVGNILSTGDITLNNITTSSGITTNITSILGNINISTGTTNTYNDLTAKQNINISNISTSLTARNLSNSGATSLQTIMSYQRTGNITTIGDITLNNITTSSGSSTNITSTAGKIIVTTGTAHTYNNLSSYSDNTITSIASYKANNISSNAKLTVSGSTLEITNTTDENNEGAPNIDIALGGDFFITNSTGNLQRSSVQVNGGLQVDNTLWKSQNLNINGYQTLSSEKVGIYFKGGRDRYIFGNIFAGGGSIWVGTSASPDNGNILLHRNAQVITNGGIKVYRDTTSNVDRFSFLPSSTITENSGIFSQLYNAAASSNSGSVTATGNIVVNPEKLIDSDSAGELVTTTGLDTFTVATFGNAIFGGIKEEIIGASGGFGSLVFGATNFGGSSEFYAKSQAKFSIFGQSIFGITNFNDNISAIEEGSEFSFARNMALSKVCLSATLDTPTAIKMQFKDATNTITNTQSIKTQTTLKGRQCFDINTTRASKVYMTSYPESIMGFKEVELWGVPTDIANISVSLNDDITLSNGSYELGGNITSKNLTITSTTSKKARVVQYSPNGVFDAKSSINLTNTTAGNTLLTHSVGNELGLKFVTDTITVGTGVLVDTSNKGYLGGNTIGESSLTNGGTGNIIPGTLAMRAGDGGTYGGVGGYGVSGGGGGGGGGGGINGLYDFSSFTFTNCGATGRNGPSLATCKSAYSTTWDENASYFGMTTNGIQEWTVPQSGTYRISAMGAGYSLNGGGALIEGDVSLYAGQKLKILVGQQGYTDNTSQTAGAGGTFITDINNVPIIVAGGGGAGRSNTSNPGESGGRTTTSAGRGYNPWYGAGAGGTDGNGGNSPSGNGDCSGAGFYGNGQCNGTVAQSFVNGGVGGSRSWAGGFGGGAGTTSWGGGGGGGYSGGGARYNGGNGPNYGDGGGGGSYNAGINQNAIAGYNGGQGSVTITKLSAKFETNSVAGAGGGNLGYGGNGGSLTCTGSVGNNTLGNTRGGNGGGANGGSGSNWHGGGGMNGCTGGGGGTGGNSDTNPYRLGSGGGAGGLITDDFNTGYGGNGGGMIRISSNTLNLYGKLVANGQVGKNYKTTEYGIKYGAGGGGAGGSILIRAKALNCNSGNSIEVKGGAGGTGVGGDLGGGGGGGGVVTYYYTEKNGTCAGVLSKGLAGTSGGGADGQYGLSYESAGTTFDTLKSRVLVENSPSEANGSDQITIRAYFLDVNGVPLEGEYLVAEITGVGGIGTGTINSGNPLSQTDANGMISFPITSTVKGIKKVILKNAVTYTELQEQPTITFGVPQISIEKIANKSVVNSGDIVTYTITLTNSGSGDAGGDTENAIVVEDVLPTGFRYYTTGPTAGSKWDTGSGSTQYYIFPETSGDGTSGNEERLRYTITDGISGPANIPANGGKVRITFDTKVP